MKKNTIMAIILILIAISIGAYFIISSRLDAKYVPNYMLEDFYKKPYKKVGVNEYTVVNVSDRDMVDTYFRTYTNMFFEDLGMAYQKLDSKFREKKYPTLNSFSSFVSSLTSDFLAIPKIKSYDIDTENGKTIYSIRDTRGNIYKFTIEAVMKYTVSFE